MWSIAVNSELSHVGGPPDRGARGRGAEGMLSRWAFLPGNTEPVYGGDDCAAGLPVRR